jgi:hypothetical protein
MVIFLLAVFFVFASFEFTNDSMDMGHTPTLRFAISVVLIGLFAVAYAATGIALRGKFWKALIPLLVLESLLMTLLGNLFPDTPRLSEFDVAEVARLHNRLTFDGCAIIISICLGYTGFVIVSLSEFRRNLKTQMEKATLESEMAAAREVQRVMVPDELPRVPGFAIESVYRPAAEVGGDFFQVIPLRSGRTLVVVGDVSGKGLRAAMIVSMIVGLLRAASDFTEEPGEILGELNRRLCGRIYDGFATCLAVRLEDGGRLAMANAGHLPPYLNGLEFPLAGSMPLGLDETAVYEQTSLEMREGDRVVLMTDGVAEARNARQELLGFSRVERLLREGATVKAVADAAQEFGQEDDLTVIGVVREG